MFCFALFWIFLKSKLLQKCSFQLENDQQNENSNLTEQTVVHIYYKFCYPFELSYVNSITIEFLINDKHLEFELSLFQVVLDQEKEPNVIELLESLGSLTYQVETC